MKRRKWHKSVSPYLINKAKLQVEIYEKAKIYWLPELNDPRNEWIEPNVPLPYYRTAYELGHLPTKLSKMSEIKEVGNHREEVVETIFQWMQKNSESVLDKTFNMESWGMEMKDSERARLALDFKKSTDKAYNPTQSVDLSINDLDFSNLGDLKAALTEELSLIDNQTENGKEEGNEEC